MLVTLVYQRERHITPTQVTEDYQVQCLYRIQYFLVRVWTCYQNPQKRELNLFRKC